MVEIYILLRHGANRIQYTALEMILILTGCASTDRGRSGSGHCCPSQNFLIWKQEKGQVTCHTAGPEYQVSSEVGG